MHTLETYTQIGRYSRSTDTLCSPHFNSWKKLTSNKNRENTIKTRPINMFLFFVVMFSFGPNEFVGWLVGRSVVHETNVYRIIYRMPLVRIVLGTWIHHNDCRDVAMSTIVMLYYYYYRSADDDGDSGGDCGDREISCTSFDCRKFYVYVLSKSKRDNSKKKKKKIIEMYIRV